MQKTEKDKVASLVGGIIAKKRKAKGYTQAVLAEKLDITQDSLSRIESGAIAPKFSRLSHIAENLECSIAELFRQPDEKINERLKYMEEKISLLNAVEQKMVMTIFDSVIDTFRAK